MRQTLSWVTSVMCLPKIKQWQMIFIQYVPLYSSEHMGMSGGGHYLCDESIQLYTYFYIKVSNVCIEWINVHLLQRDCIFLGDSWNSIHNMSQESYHLSPNFHFQIKIPRVLISIKHPVEVQVALHGLLEQEVHMQLF